MDSSMPPRAQVRPTRRLVAVGIIRNDNGRIVRITATPAGVAGSSRPAVTR